MSKKQKTKIGPFLALILLIILMAATNPSTAHFRTVMRDQKSLKLELASRLPIHRANYILLSKFDIKYGIGQTTCYGALGYVFICPDKNKTKND